MTADRALPLDRGGGPGEACAEGDHDDVVAAPEAAIAVGFVERDGHGGGGGVAVLVQVDEDPLVGDREPVGKGVAGQTADVLAFARSKGAFAGLTVEGAVIKIRNKWNDAYYGESVRPSDILISRKVSNSQADTLRRSVRKTAGK